MVDASLRADATWAAAEASWAGLSIPSRRPSPWSDRIQHSLALSVLRHEAVPSASMTTPWLDDACSLVEAFRARRLSPLEALDACIEAIERSPLNAFSHTDFERARETARRPMSRCPSAASPSG